MADTEAIVRRLDRVGLSREQVQAALEQNAHDLDGFQRWLESVHNDDVKEKYGVEEVKDGQPDPGAVDDGQPDPGAKSRRGHHS